MGANASARIVDLDTSTLLNSSMHTQPESLVEMQALARLSAVLQTTIELREILRLFYSEVQRAVSLEGIEYQHPNQHFDYCIGQIAGHSSHYRLQTHSDFLGELSLHRLHQPFSDDELYRLDKLVSTLLYPVRNGLRYLEAVRASLTDGLTGAGNRINLENVLGREVDQANRYQQPLSILVLDLDHFKKINDQHGHAAGDYVLKIVANTLRLSSRSADTLFRFGGEEFVVLLNNTDIAGAKTIAERIRLNIEGLCLRYADQQIPITLSVGMATLCHNESKESLLDRADKALYLAKKNGRNQVALAEPMLASAMLQTQ